MICHEYTHGLGDRLVGGGVGIGPNKRQSRGPGEGWADFYALSLLSEAENDVNGNCAFAVYPAYHDHQRRDRIVCPAATGRRPLVQVELCLAPQLIMR